MEYCIECGSKLKDKADFCNNCGKQIKHLDEQKKDTKDKKSIEKQIEDTAEEIGRKAEQIGKRIEKKANNAGKYINQWYDQTFKIAGPLIGAFIALIVIRIIIYFIQLSTDDIYILTALSKGLYDYLLIIFVSMLISGYNTYFHRKYKQQYQWIYPLISAIGFIIGAWIVAKILIIIDQNDNTPILASIGNFVDTYLIVIFILALIIGYGIQIAYLFRYSEKK
jgi:hypothetical protein